MSAPPDSQIVLCRDILEQSWNRSYGCPDSNAIFFEVKLATGTPQPLEAIRFRGSLLDVVTRLYESVTRKLLRRLRFPQDLGGKT